MITAEQIDLLGKLLEVLHRSGVRTFKMDELAFELGPVYRTSPLHAGPMESASPEEHARLQKKALEDLLYASAGA